MIMWSKIHEEHTYMIFVLFSPQTQFLAQFFSTQKRVNHSKKISTKQRKSPKTWFFNSLMRQNTINCTHHLSNLQIVFTFLTWRTLSTCQSVMWRISSSNNMSCGEISPHGRFFLHGHRPWCPWQIWSMGAENQGISYPELSMIVTLQALCNTQ